MPPGISKRNIFTVAILALSVLVGAATTAQASTLTVFFSGNIDLTLMGGPANSSYSGFFTWDPAKLPTQPDPITPLYPVESYQLLVNGVDKTIGPGGTGAGMAVNNDGDLEGNPGPYDALAFLAGLDPVGDAVFVLAFLTDDLNFWDTIALPTDYNFLSMPMRFSIVSLEAGDDQQVGEGGSFVATPAAVPEPATLTLTALGLAGLVTRARRSRQRR
jgi:PEP-CTERM motif